MKVDNYITGSNENKMSSGVVLRRFNFRTNLLPTRNATNVFNLSVRSMVSEH